MATDANAFIKNAPNTITFPIMDSTNAPLTGATVSGADSEVSIDGAIFVDCGSEFTEITRSGTNSGVYRLDLTAAECSGEELVYLIRSTVAGTIDRVVIPEVLPAMDSGEAVNGGANTITLRLGASALDDYYNNNIVEIVRGTGAGQSKMILDYEGSTRIATVDRNWVTQPDSTSVYIIHALIAAKATSGIPDVNVKSIDGDETAATLFKSLYQGGLIAGTINDTSPTDTSFNGDVGLSSVDDFFNGQLLVMTDGSQSGDAKRISDYVGSSKLITLVGALSGAPANGDAFVILGRII